MGNSLNYAKEVYYHFRNEHGEAKVVPVRGVYVTEEFKPPMYFEPILRLHEVNTNHCTIEDYIETTIKQTVPTSHHLYDMSFYATYRMTSYTQASIPNQRITTTHHLYDMSFYPTFSIYEYTQQKLPNQVTPTTHHLYDMTFMHSNNVRFHTKVSMGSQPEPLIRLIELDVGTSTIEDLN